MKDSGWMGINKPIPHKELYKGVRYDVEPTGGSMFSGVYAGREADGLVFTIYEQGIPVPRTVDGNTKIYRVPDLYVAHPNG